MWNEEDLKNESFHGAIYRYLSKFSVRDEVGLANVRSMYTKVVKEWKNSGDTSLKIK